MIKFSPKAIAAATAGLSLAGVGVGSAFAAVDAAPQKAPTAAHSEQNSARSAPAAQDRLVDTVAKKAAEVAPKVAKDIKDSKAGKDAKSGKTAKKAILPSGISTATSFWDPGTASGKPMSFKTLASPYWPLGTKVKITYNGKSAIGVVEDFGPAEWAVAQHNPPAIIDLSELMMKKLTGVRSNSVTIKFQVLKLGDGRVYRHGGTGYGLATGK